ncbi:MAG: AAA family ATPase [Sterolibacterium sp.]
MLRLGKILEAHAITLKDLATFVGVSRSAISLLVNHGQWPRLTAREEIEQQVKAFLTARGVCDLAGCFEEDQAACTPPVQSAAEGRVERSIDMLLRKESVSPAARKHFGLFKDPFSNDIGGREDVFMGRDHRYVLESMWDIARGGGFGAVVGESGAGKSTLRKALEDRIEHEGLQIVTIQPYVLRMEDNDVKGKTLKSANIEEAIIEALAPTESPRRTMEARSRQVHRLLKESGKSGKSHVLIIEEAHSLPTPTLKHLKRFWELTEGYKHLLGVLLIGQTELGQKLDERNPAVREVTQRCEIITLSPLDEQLAEYLEFKFKRVGKTVGDIFEPGAVEALRASLTETVAGKSTMDSKTFSMAYPLAVHNLIAACMNRAAELCFPKVDAGVVTLVRGK